MLKKLYCYLKGWSIGIELNSKQKRRNQLVKR